MSKVNSHDLHGDPGKQASPPYTGSEWREPSVHTTRASRGDTSATLTLFFCGSSNAQLGQQPGSKHCYEHGMIPNLKTTCKVTSLFHFAGGRDTGPQRGGLLAHRPQKETPTWPPRDTALLLIVLEHRLSRPDANVPRPSGVAAIRNLKSFSVCLVGELIS